jgi:hypothetical protein
VALAARRDFLRAGAGCALAGLAARGASQDPAARLVPKRNGALNVQPLRRFEAAAGAEPLIEPELVALQMRAVYELGFERIRITVPFGRFGPDFLGAVPYVRCARALGIDVLAVMADFTGFDLAQALVRDATRAEVVAAYLAILDGPGEVAAPAVKRRGELALQVLNEPTHFLGLTPRDYAFELLAPVRDAIRVRSDSVRVAAAAALGNVDGLARLRELFQLGYDRYCDVVAYHVYSRRLIPALAGLARGAVWVTESGVDGTARHRDWYTRTFQEIRETLPEVERLYWFDLFDRAPGRFRLIDIVRDGPGFAAVPESAGLIAHLEERVAEAAAGRPLLAFADLVPDVTDYFPTPADLDVIAATSFA